MDVRELNTDQMKAKIYSNHICIRNMRKAGRLITYIALIETIALILLITYII